MSHDNFMIWKINCFIFCLKTISATDLSTLDYYTHTVPAGVVVNFTIQSQSDASGFGYPPTTKRSSLTFTSVLTCKLLSYYPNRSEWELTQLSLGVLHTAQPHFWWSTFLKQHTLVMKTQIDVSFTN